MKSLPVYRQPKFKGITATSILIVAFALAMSHQASPVQCQEVGGEIDPLAASVIDAVRGKIASTKQGLVFNDVASNVIPDTEKPCVVLVPGLLASGRSMTAFCKEIEKQAFSTAVFHYSSHQGIKPSATQLATELRRLKVSQPTRRVVLLTHSMGGLVARCCVEDPALNPGNVTQLLLVAPPNHGSAVAKLSAAELSKKLGWQDPICETGLKSVDDAAGSLFGNAKVDLLPGSATLLELNARPRAAGVRYCVIAGSGGPVPGELIQLSLLVGNLLLPESPETQAAFESVSELAKLDEWTQGRGDGVVAVSSARLSGVKDFLTLPFSHNEFGETTSEAGNQVIAEVLKRLENR